MSGTKPLFHRDAAKGSTLRRTTYDGNSFADINKLQDQIGDLTEFITDFGDSSNDTDSNEGLVSYLNYLRDKIIGDSNSAGYYFHIQEGKTRQMAGDGSFYELIPAGLIIMIAGESKTDRESGDIAGLSECPVGYIPCEDQSLVRSINSAFKGGTNMFAPDMRGLMLRGAGGAGVNSEHSIANIGYVQGNWRHRHTIQHTHHFTHNHEHSHTNYDHIHRVDHNHQFTMHYHEISDHKHWWEGGTEHWERDIKKCSWKRGFDVTSDQQSHSHFGNGYTKGRKSFDIKNSNKTSNFFKIKGNFTHVFPENQMFQVYDSYVGNDGNYRVLSDATYDSGTKKTTIPVDGSFNDIYSDSSAGRIKTRLTCNVGSYSLQDPGEASFTQDIETYTNDTQRVSDTEDQTNAPNGTHSGESGGEDFVGNVAGPYGQYASDSTGNIPRSKTVKYCMKV